MPVGLRLVDRHHMSSLGMRFVRIEPGAWDASTA